MKKSPLIRLFVMILVFQGSEVQSQSLYLSHEGPKDKCLGDILFFGVKNRIILSDNNNLPVGGYDLISDSVNIERINDSLFIFSPLYKNVTINVFAIDSKRKQKTASIKVTCEDSPVRFFIGPNPRLTLHDPFQSPNIFIPGIDHIRMVPRKRECYDYSAGLKVISYRLCLIRGNEEIASLKVKGKRRVKEKFKMELRNKIQTGDYIALRDISIKNGEGKSDVLVEQSVFKLW